MEITVLLENTKPEGSNFSTENGLSLLLEINDEIILFDAGGPENSAIKNAEKMEIDLHIVDAVVISHAHDDHTGGLSNFMQINHKAPIYLKKDVFNHYYVRNPEGDKYIGIPPGISDKYPERLKFVEKTVKIAPGVFLVPQIKKTYPLPTSNKVLFTENKHEKVNDNFEHELFMVVQKDDSIIIFSGCGHNGIKNIVNTAVKLFPGKNIGAVIGGFHLQSGSRDYAMAREEEIIEIANWLKSEVNGNIYTGHCTGKRGFDLMKPILQDKLKDIYTGMKIKL
jgi:7,8-dihydropterin-6-yl-methyl-4-(beta-D-ribofuranosyl)aminobenzene 5'-phosphate synthase